MSTFLFIFYVLFGFFGIIYTFLILFYTFGWYRLKSFVPPKDMALRTRSSVIIPARNESMNILHLLNDLVRQTLPKELFEVILVDDHSTDNTAALADHFRIEHPELSLKLIRLTTDHKTTTFKKKAIEEAIQASTGDLIITTDADCRAGSRWLETVVAYYEAKKPQMVVGPVSFHNEESMFEKMQTEEFLSLIAITGGAIRMQKPLMCNGANLAYGKAAFYKAGGFGANRFSSGDDVFLMLQIRKIFGSRSIRFLKSKTAIVYTEAKKNLAGFFQQRTRWASKNKGYDTRILVVSVTVYMINLLILTGLIHLFNDPSQWRVMLIIMMIKVLIDFPILAGIGKFAGRPGIILYSIPLVVLYPVYIVLVGAMGILGNYRWKGRKVKN